MNKTQLIGRLTRDPELKYAPGSGTAIATFSLAVNRTFKKEGQPDADFLNIVSFGKQGENVSKYLHKGSLVGVSGRIQTGSYEAKDGSKRYTTEIISDEVQFLDSKGSDDNQSPSKPPSDDEIPIDDGDIPF
ncbi:single-stranded DNA-binding protein [Clostridium sp. MT-14]|uniref:single-stranded DNA-binding protein n=1 Tax=Clostridium sp. MT-14 TaxID=3348360 RepID=UPI0035F32FFE